MSTEHTDSISNYGDDGHSASSVDVPEQIAEDSSGSQATGSAGNSGRRRRRRRKNKGPATATAVIGVAAASQQQAVTVEEGAVTASAPPPLLQTQAPQQQNNHSQANGKRKNGRKRSGSAGGGGASNGSSVQPGPGNSSNANHGQNRSRQGRQNTGSGFKARSEGPDGNREGARGGFGSEPFQDNTGNGNTRRKGKFGRRGPTSFVGPMDHSYRMVNGNVADGSPSTMDFRNPNANGNMNGRNDFAEAEPVLAVARPDAPTRIICFIEDLFVVAKMQETARKLGIKVQFAKAEKEALAAITDVPEAERPSLIVFDLNNVNAKPLTLIPKLKAKLKRGTSIIGYLQHIQGDLKLKAMEAGCDSVMPRSAFSQNLPNLLRRHGFDEKEEMMEA